MMNIFKIKGYATNKKNVKKKDIFNSQKKQQISYLNTSLPHMINTNTINGGVQFNKIRFLYNANNAQIIV